MKIRALDIEAETWEVSAIQEIYLEHFLSSSLVASITRSASERPFSALIQAIYAMDVSIEPEVVLGAERDLLSFIGHPSDGVSAACITSVAWLRGWLWATQVVPLTRPDLESQAESVGHAVHLKPTWVRGQLLLIDLQTQLHRWSAAVATASRLAELPDFRHGGSSSLTLSVEHYITGRLGWSNSIGQSLLEKTQSQANAAP